jgi:hypothetical protein
MNPGCGCAGPSESAAIQINATLCGESWHGDLTYVLTCEGEDDIVGATAPGSHTVAPGEWTCEYDTGGPPGSTLLDIKPSVNQTVTAGGTITFTLEFEQGQDASIEFVGWTINGEPVPPQDPYNPDWYFLISGFNATLGAACGLACCLDGRKQQRNQNPDDGDHHQQFDQRERPHALSSLGHESVLPLETRTGQHLTRTIVRPGEKRKTRKKVNYPEN